MIETDNYYRRRVEEELAAAERAADPSISEIHRDMARRYLDRLASEGGQANRDTSIAGAMGGAIVEQGSILA